MTAATSAELEDDIERVLGARIFVLMEELFAHCEACGEDALVTAAALANGAALMLVEDGYPREVIMRAFADSLAWADAAHATARGGDA